MTTAARIALVPQYMHKFACIGSDCEDTCCIGFQVHIDKNTYDKYSKMKDPKWGTKLRRAVKRVESPSSEADYATLNVINNGPCPLLNENNLCVVHKDLGEDYLSPICASYPRLTNMVSGTMEVSTALSCPEAARAALLNPDGIEFDEIEESSVTPRLINAHFLPADDHNLANTPQGHFWELRIFTIGVLQDRRYSLTDRLLILGLFYSKAQELANTGQAAGLPALVARYREQMDDPSFRDSFASVPAKPVVQINLLKELIDMRVSYGTTSPRYLECYEELLSGIQYREDASYEELAENYQKAHDQQYRPFMDQHEYILENYLVNTVFAYLFPFGNKSESLFQAYTFLILNYALLKMHLVGLAGHHKGLDLDLIIKCIQSYSKTTAQHYAFLKNTYAILEHSGHLSLPYLAVLIKN